MVSIIDLTDEHFDVFMKEYECFALGSMPKEVDHVDGGKIFMCPKSLGEITDLRIHYPLIFKLTNRSTGDFTHCGVLEFGAPDGKVHVPPWIMRNLSLDEGSLVLVESVNLPVATYARFQPQSALFLDIHSPKAVLESTLRKFACLTTGDMLAIKYNDQVHELLVLETQPADAVDILECDMHVDFAPHLGFVQPSRDETEAPSKEEEMDEIHPLARGHFMAFAGPGNRLGGERKRKSSPNKEEAKRVAPDMPRGIPDYNYKVGSLTFMRNSRPPPKEEDEVVSTFTPFSGQGHKLNPSPEPDTETDYEVDTE